MLKSFYKDGVLEAGCDEAGRGCIAGPVVAAAVILPPDFKDNRLNDSKKLSEKQRYLLRDVIVDKSIAWAIEMVDNRQIDKINILNASILAMNMAVKALNIKPQHLIIDGNRFYTDTQISFTTIIKGDAKYASIAAASILAKTFRDDFMIKMHTEYPVYCWNKNKGYPTKQHKEAVRKYGLTPLHRKSFNMAIQTKLDL